MQICMFFYSTEQESLPIDDLQRETEKLDLSTEEAPSSGIQQTVEPESPLQSKEPTTEPESETVTQTQQGSPSGVRSSLATIGEDLEEDEDDDKDKEAEVSNTGVNFVVGD